MTDPQPDHDKTFAGEIEAIRRAEQNDPLVKAIAVIAQTMGIYRRQLLAQGFTADEAMALLADWQRAIIARMNL